jgi:hypothetical protein
MKKFLSPIQQKSERTGSILSDLSVATPCLDLKYGCNLACCTKRQLQLLRKQQRWKRLRKSSCLKEVARETEACRTRINRFIANFFHIEWGVSKEIDNEIFHLLDKKFESNVGNEHHSYFTEQFNYIEILISQFCCRRLWKARRRPNNFHGFLWMIAIYFERNPRQRRSQGMSHVECWEQPKLKQNHQFAINAHSWYFYSLKIYCQKAETNQLQFMSFDTIMSLQSEYLDCFCYKDKFCKTAQSQILEIISWLFQNFKPTLIFLKITSGLSEIARPSHF